MRIPFTNPMRAAAPTAVRIAIQMRLSDCSPTPAMIMAASVKRARGAEIDAPGHDDQHLAERGDREQCTERGDR